MKPNQVILKSGPNTFVRGVEQSVDVMLAVKDNVKAQLDFCNASLAKYPTSIQLAEKKEKLLVKKAEINEILVKCDELGIEPTI